MEQKIKKARKVSVLVPVYNVKSYLKQCLDSLAAQTLDGIEFICIDDGSTDGCSEILDAYAKTDARFRVIHKENSGYGASMNVGLRTARGKYIGIVESDDFADDEMFERLYDIAEEQQAEVVRSNFWATTQEGSVYCETLSGHPYEKLLCPMKEDPELVMAMQNIWSAIYRKDFLAKHDIWFHETPGASYQDVSFAFEVIASAEKYFLVKDAWLHYRMDNASSSVHSKGKVFCLSDEYDAIEDFLQKQKRDKTQHVWAAKLFLSTIFVNETRIAPEYVPAYWKRAISQLEWAQEHGYFEHELLQDPQGWILQRVSRIQKLVFLAEGFCKMLRDAPHVYLYGAGQVARRMVRFLGAQGISVSGLLVQELVGNPASVDGVPVEVWQEADADREHDLVVIAVTPRKPEVQQEIFFQLEQAGYRNVIVLTKELQEALA